MREKSPFELERIKSTIEIPECLKDLPALEAKVIPGKKRPPDKLKAIFPHTIDHPYIHFQKCDVPKKGKDLKVGVVLSGGQASGGHNVIVGLFEGLFQLGSGAKLFGFLGGPAGIVESKYKELTAPLLAEYRNTGGFDLIGSGRTKIETNEQLESALKTVQNISLDGLVIIGGDDSNTNAAILAEHFQEKKCATVVVGVPKTIDGDLKSEDVEISFGFDTACRTYSEMIGNIARDALSAKKYYHFIKLMGRSASHIALECALQTQPNLTLIGEEVAAKKQTLAEITKEIADLICERKKNYGVILIPEGLIEFIPEVKQLISEINAIFAKGTHNDVLSHLSEEAKMTFSFLPEKVQHQLLLDRDPHGNVQVSQIATEELLIHAVKKELLNRDDYKGKFFPINHFLGYEGRSAFPTHFDATYCYALGLNASLLIREGCSGYMSVLSELTAGPAKWRALGVPIVSLMTIEERKGLHGELMIVINILGPSNLMEGCTIQKHFSWSINV